MKTSIKSNYIEYMFDDICETQYDKTNPLCIISQKHYNPRYFRRKVCLVVDFCTKHINLENPSLCTVEMINLMEVCVNYSVKLEQTVHSKS